MICNDLCSPKSITVLITICCGGSAAAVAAIKSGSARFESSCVLRVRGLAMLSRAVALLLCVWLVKEATAGVEDSSRWALACQSPKL